jgi:predicted nucleic acid-binding Zn finger protein
MTDYEPDGNERIDSRTERALTQYLTVLADVGRAKGADDLFLVVSQSGTEYLVDRREGRCTCPDHEHRGVRCKHLRRVAFATGERAVPAFQRPEPPWSMEPG